MQQFDKEAFEKAIADRILSSGLVPNTAMANKTRYDFIMGAYAGVKAVGLQTPPELLTMAQKERPEHVRQS